MEAVIRRTMIDHRCDSEQEKLKLKDFGAGVLRKLSTASDLSRGPNQRLFGLYQRESRYTEDSTSASNS
jgi:hypothetical protein